MKFEFGRVVFFGRNIDEYVLMFNLDLNAMVAKKVLDCCSGPAAFAVKASELGINITACDPMYDSSSEELRELIDRDSLSVAEKQERTPQFFHAEFVPTSVRRQAMEIFLQDYERNRTSGRYICASLPDLPFADRAFDLVLCSNLLFLYSEIGTGGMMENSPFDYAFHQHAVAELLRVCNGELRLYPLQGPDVTEHSFLRPLMSELCAQGFKVELQSVLQRDVIGAEKLLSVTRSTQPCQ